MIIYIKNWNIGSISYFKIIIFNPDHTLFIRFVATSRVPLLNQNKVETLLNQEVTEIITS